MTARPGLARRKGAAQRGKKTREENWRQKLLITSQKTHFCGSLCWAGKNSCSHFICNSECRPAFVPQLKETRTLPTTHCPSLSRSPAWCPSEPNYYFHEFKLWFALRTFLAFPLLWWPPPLDVNYVYARLVLRPLDRAPFPPRLPMQPHLFLCVQSLWSSGFSLGSPGQALWSS